MFFDSLSKLTNFVGASCKRKEMLRDKSFKNVVQGLLEGDILSGRGHNQEVSLSRAGATRWGSHYRTVLSLIYLYGPTANVLVAIGNETKVERHRADADSLLQIIQSFIELLKFLSEHNEDINSVVLDNAPGNLKMTAPSIQKDIINAFAVETTKVIIKDLCDNLFTILVDEARDISVKEQMAIVLRFVDDRGFIVERFLGVAHVADTTLLSLKRNIDTLLCHHGLSISSLRGKGYDGASNMSGEINSLKSLILMENQAAYYVRCFAHQLKLSLVNVAEGHTKVKMFFDSLSTLTNFVGASCKIKDMLRDKSFENVVQGLLEGDILSGRGQNQEVSLSRAGATFWGSHYKTVLSFIFLYGPTVNVLIAIGNETKVERHLADADSLLQIIQSFIELLKFLAEHNEDINSVVLDNAPGNLKMTVPSIQKDIINEFAVETTKVIIKDLGDNLLTILVDEARDISVKEQIYTSTKFNNNQTT